MKPFSGRSITCPKCQHHWLRKPTREENVALAITGKADKRLLLYVLQNGRCAICGLKMKDDVTLDHIYPKSRGGENKFNNYQAVHLKCNQEKADNLFGKEEK